MVLPCYGSRQASRRLCDRLAHWNIWPAIRDPCADDPPADERRSDNGKRESSAILMASRNSDVCCAVQPGVATLPAKSTARMVPATAMPTAAVTSVAVSISAAPIVVRFFGRPRRSPVGATTRMQQHIRPAKVLPHRARRHLAGERPPAPPSRARAVARSSSTARSPSPTIRAAKSSPPSRNAA